MGRKKIQISRILDQRNRQVTFTKRKFGLMKKAYELSVLCDCEIALIIFNSTNRLFQYASTDMDKVLLKYTEYSEPHESRTNADILETLRRKGLGLDGAELDPDEAAQAAVEKYQQLNEGLDLSVARQRYYAPQVLPPEAQYLVTAGCENGFPVGSPPGLGVHRTPAFKPVGPKLGAPNPHHTLSSLMPPHSAIGYSMFSHGNLSRALEMKTPPPLNLGCENRRAEAHPGLPGPRPNLSNARALYQGMHSGNPMMGVGKAGLLGHSLGEYGLSPAGPPEYPHHGFSHSVNLQRNSVSPWQPPHHQEAHVSHISQGVPDGGCAFPAPTPASPPQSSLNLSIKSERVSPEHTCSPTTPPLHHMMHPSPISSTDSLGQIAPEPYAANEREAFQKGAYPPPHNVAKAQPEDKSRLLARRLETAEAWPR
ncbi:myocyte-specific enhancer factor 2B isoform X2 [Conger conger]|uniref:myocyte-specific enhancer factor 2B isoform X2 n=1 Tax=Conger conger TaxID=82655 RepID=UPI002A5AC7E3|nr:myocyte-specific enhancer factor 2B isoform X2 [Conger conger]